ncbi:MAG: DNA primase, partial [Holdemanella sp.]|nr:DNA primase [Holdemanella sp.]
MSWIKEEDMRAIRQQADIVDIISRYLTVEKRGKDYRAICPFHDDHDPSLTIAVDKQIFKCFV